MVESSSDRQREKMTSLLKASQEPQDVKVYMSSVPSNVHFRKHQNRVEDILAARKIAFNAIDVSTDDKEREFCKQKYTAATGQASLPVPLIFSFGEFRGGIQEIEDVNEQGAAELKAWLKL